MDSEQFPVLLALVAAWGGVVVAVLAVRRWQR